MARACSPSLLVCRVPCSLSPPLHHQGQTSATQALEGWGWAPPLVSAPVQVASSAWSRDQVGAPQLQPQSCERSAGGEEGSASVPGPTQRETGMATLSAAQRGTMPCCPPHLSFHQDPGRANPIRGSRGRTWRASISICNWENRMVLPETQVILKQEGVCGHQRRFSLTKSHTPSPQPPHLENGTVTAPASLSEAQVRASPGNPLQCWAHSV